MTTKGIINGSDEGKATETKAHEHHGRAKKQPAKGSGKKKGKQKAMAAP